MVWLVAGLGNPGDRYARTRHNLGRLAAEELARTEGERFRKARFLSAETTEIHVVGERVILALSTRHMNESGTSYASLARKHDVEVDHVIAVHDELDIPEGTLRLKKGGGPGGHNGLKSLQQALRSPDFLRVRIGIGRPPGRQDPADFVLEPIPKRMDADAAIMVDRAAEAVRALIADGFDAAQDRFHRSGPGA